MVPCVQAHLQILRENDIFGWVFVPVLAVELMDIAPLGRAVFLTGSAVLHRGVIEHYRNCIDQQGTKHKFQCVGCPPQSKRIVH